MKPSKTSFFFFLIQFPSITVHSHSCFCSSVILSASVPIPGVYMRGCRRGRGRSLWVCVPKGDVFPCKMGILSLKKLKKNFTSLRAYCRNGQNRGYLEKPQEQQGESPAVGLARGYCGLDWRGECVGWEQGWRSPCLGSARSRSREAGDSRVTTLRGGFSTPFLSAVSLSGAVCPSQLSHPLVWPWAAQPARGAWGRCCSPGFHTRTAGGWALAAPASRSWTQDSWAAAFAKEIFTLHGAPERCWQRTCGPAKHALGRARCVCWSQLTFEGT